MRVLLTCRATIGHFLPLLPAAEGLLQAGHEVACATGPALRDRVEEAGLPFWPAGPDHLPAGARAALLGDMSGMSPIERRAAHFCRIFVDHELPPRAAALEEIVNTWSPDLLVHDVAELAAPLVASAHGIPYASHSFGAAIPADILAAVGAAAATHWRRAGQQPQPFAGLSRYLYLDNWPAALHDGAHAVAAPNVQQVRPVTRHRTTGRQGEPCIYVTLGTVFNDDYDLFRTIVAAVAGLDRKVVVTVGDNGDVSRLADVPGNVQVATFIPQDAILPDCQLVVAHGGAGTTLGALAHGCPLLLLPQGADQHSNAARVAAAGAGLTADSHDRSETQLHRMASALLSEESYRQAAEAIAADIAAMPGPHEVARRLEELVESSTP